MSSIYAVLCYGQNTKCQAMVMALNSGAKGINASVSVQGGKQPAVHI